MRLTREEILRLSVAERLQLVKDLWASIEEEQDVAPLTEAQRTELKRRLAQYARDPSGTLTWAEVRKRAGG
jgi:putative addiction module component (TIGR02574 family)